MPDGTLHDPNATATPTKPPGADITTQADFLENLGKRTTEGQAQLDNALASGNLVAIETWLEVTKALAQIGRDYFEIERIKVDLARANDPLEKEALQSQINLNNGRTEDLAARTEIAFTNAASGQLEAANNALAAESLADLREEQAKLVAAQTEAIGPEVDLTKARTGGVRAQTTGTNIESGQQALLLQQQIRQDRMQRQWDALVAKKLQAAEGLTSTVPVGPTGRPSAGGIVATVQVQASWSSADEAQLRALTLQLGAAGVSIPPIDGITSVSGGFGVGPANQRFRQTAAEQILADEMDRELQRTIARARTESDFLLQQLEASLRVRIEQSEIDAQRALSIYAEEGANIRTRASLIRDEAQRLQSDVNSRRALAGSILATTADFTKFLLDRRVPEDRRFLIQPGTVQGGPEGVPIDRTKIDPNALAQAAITGVGLEEGEAAAKAAGAAATAAAETVAVGATIPERVEVGSVELPDAGATARRLLEGS